MDEADWLTSEDPNPMLATLHGQTSARKMRLFACACCRQFVWGRLADERTRDAVGVAERYADGLVRRAVLDEAGEDLLLDRLERLGVAEELRDADEEVVIQAVQLRFVLAQ